MTPGRILHRLARHVCDPASLERIVEPPIADFQHEWAKAQTAVESARVLVRGYAAVGLALGWTAGRTFVDDILSVTWRDAFPMPGMFVVILVLIGASESWVRTGTPWSMWGQRLTAIDTTQFWALIPSVLVGRYWAGLNWKPRAVWMTICVGLAVIATQVETMAILRGWQAFLTWVLVTTVLQSMVTRRVPPLTTNHSDH